MDGLTGRCIPQDQYCNRDSSVLAETSPLFRFLKTSCSLTTCHNSSPGAHQTPRTQLCLWTHEKYLPLSLPRQVPIKRTKLLPLAVRPRLHQTPPLPRQLPPPLSRPDPSSHPPRLMLLPWPPPRPHARASSPASSRPRPQCVAPGASLRAISSHRRWSRSRPCSLASYL